MLIFRIIGRQTVSCHFAVSDLKTVKNIIYTQAPFGESDRGVEISPVILYFVSMSSTPVNHLDVSYSCMVSREYEKQAVC